MPAHARTDDIAKSAWDATKTHWKEFILLPTLVFIIFGALYAGGMFLFGYPMNEPTPPEGFGYGAGIFATVMTLAFIVAGMVIFTAMHSWCQQLHKGAETLDLKAGIRHGLSRFWGVLGTSLLTGIKVFLWTLLFIIPGLYKGAQYFQSVYISQSEGISGGDANQLSKKLVTEAGFLRTVCNIMGMQTVVTIVFYTIIAIVFIVVGLLQFIHPVLSGVVSVAILIPTFLFMMAFFMNFFSFQYLYFWDENKASLEAMKADLAKMKEY